MLGSYGSLLRVPRAGDQLAVSLVAGLPFGAFALPLLLLVQRNTGSFAAAGAALAAFSLAQGLFAPARGRLVDVRGVRAALGPLVVVHAAGLAGTGVAGAAGAGAVVLCAGAAVTGASAPPLVAAMRTQWRVLTGDDPLLLQRAYALDGAGMSAVFVVGPILSGVGVATIGPSATLAACGASMLVAGLAFAQLADAERLTNGPSTRGLGPIAGVGLQTLVVSTIVLDSALGLLDVGTVAFATREGHDATGGLLLGLFAAGSIVGGLYYGARTWRGDPARRYVVACLALALGFAPLALANTIPALAVLLVFAGMPLAAVFVTTTLLLDRMTAAGAAAEAYTWISAANGAGLALGSALAGVLVDGPGTTTTFLVAAAAAGGGALVGRWPDGRPSPLRGS